MPFNNKIICVNKPLYWSSFDVVKKFKSNYKLKKVGHAGTLDPLASGLLVLTTGSCTKQIASIQNKPKTYTAQICLGGKTKSADREFLPESLENVSKSKETSVRSVIQKFFIGELEQRPPLFSAIKIKGKRAYKIARSKPEKELVIKPKKITVYQFKVHRFQKTKNLLQAYPDFGYDYKTRSIPHIESKLVEQINGHTFAILNCTIVCSKGTYIRSLARDLGQKLGLGGFLVGLQRTEIGEYSLQSEEIVNI